ncbi:M14 family metallocarboxypeptidase [Tepidibacillus infernus]|uniref:Peptidase M14 n=1 Tax=Tepidibacillus decaturensis TaxID=1413211 RepID=A0A135L824_9BACI|nr:M14 family metallocarboxypeptidase [Tepidibacillus decaturensis]KXG45013.1 peptidase M14 [Tepidibacillus decaturensis]
MIKKDDIVQTNEEYSYEDLVADIEALKSRYPFIQTDIIGSSVMGKSIYAIRLGIGQKEVFYSGDWHANEYLTAPLLMKFVEDYAKAYTQKRTLRGYDIEYLYRNNSIWIVPMVNPDGVELVIEGITPSHPFYQSVLRINSGSKDFRGWTANIRGVDLNHQWPADWEQENDRSPQVPSPRKYGGTRPLTEPETIAIYDFTKKHNFRMVLAFHSQCQVIYWGFKGMEPPESEKIVNRMAILTGYVPEKTAYSGAGYKDWFIQEFRKPGFTIEVGIGINPLPVSQFPQIYRENLAVLLEAPLL